MNLTNLLKLNFLYHYNRDWLIDKKVENAVEGMQKVIELGRLARDRRALPIKVCLFNIYTLD